MSTPRMKGCITSDYYEIKELPLYESFTWAGLDIDIKPYKLRKWRMNDVLINEREASDINYAKYRVTRAAREFIQDYDPATLPCGHRPFSNPRGVEGYTCICDDCDARYSQREIEAVLNGIDRTDADNEEVTV